MKHKYPEKEIEIGDHVILVYNKLASAGKNNSPSKFIEVSGLVRKYLKAKIVVLPDESLNIEPDPSVPILIFGGDGTVHKVITEIFRKYKGNITITVGHLRGGTMNTVATCLRIPERKSLLRKISMGRKINVIPRRAIEVITEENHLFGFIFGAIAPYKFLEKYYNGVALGPIGGAKTLIETVLQALLKNDSEVVRKEKAKIKADEIQVETDFMIIGAGTVHSFGLDFSNFPLAPCGENTFNLIAYRGSPKRLATYLPLIYFGKLPKDAINILVKKAEIEFQDKVGFTVDGDLYRARKIKLGISPEINFIV